MAGVGFDDGKGARLHVGGGLLLEGEWTNIARLKSATGGTPSCGDLNGDGVVNQQDLGILLGDWGCTAGVGLCPGDCGVCGAACGDFFCDSPETGSTCPEDC